MPEDVLQRTFAATPLTVIVLPVGLSRRTAPSSQQKGLVSDGFFEVGVHSGTLGSGCPIIVTLLGFAPPEQVVDVALTGAHHGVGNQIGAGPVSPTFSAYATDTTSPVVVVDPANA